ncbi:hypothetical protein CSX11_30185 [Mycobacterium goodii]|nr:hypothetical protein CSX11_30185 [Mycolicibacterium goodii]
MVDVGHNGDVAKIWVRTHSVILAGSRADHENERAPSR